MMVGRGRRDDVEIKKGQMLVKVGKAVKGSMSSRL